MTRAGVNIRLRCPKTCGNCLCVDDGEHCYGLPLDDCSAQPIMKLICPLTCDTCRLLDASSSLNAPRTVVRYVRQAVPTSVENVQTAPSDTLLRPATSTVILRPVTSRMIFAPANPLIIQAQPSDAIGKSTYSNAGLFRNAKLISEAQRNAFNIQNRNPSLAMQNPLYNLMLQ